MRVARSVAAVAHLVPSRDQSIISSRKARFRQLIDWMPALYARMHSSVTGLLSICRCSMEHETYRGTLTSSDAAKS
jgi:hypothetical protein